ncbi:regulator of chromosome condensation [Orpheovirus IHUMI-LCC2]|uniref:Chromosome condensation regulator RCC1 with F-box domain n=1 Tax=Orpheovirus IHUMI-LCC2 TaxID=2023057 RepID=A0A2I2L466_9VIRU|nr:regulator of chromosome condensation [Orpheovirus IHUMI-LCC2]SNW62318.1 Chromosome condensation regulator RCC1 with F-box domain [Orpheovirus IHUMI-LCC2]
MDYIQLLPNEILECIILHMNKKEVNNIYSTSSVIYNILYNNNRWWKRKCLLDYGDRVNEYEGVDYKYLYFNWNNVTIIKTKKDYDDMSELDNLLGKHIILDGICARDISCGNNHILIIGINGYVYGYGSNSVGQLGLGDIEYVSTSTILLDNEGKRIKAKKVSCGGSYSFIIDINDNLYATGDNFDGQLGINEENKYIWKKYNSKVLDIACGNSHSLRITMKGNVEATGNNYDCALGIGNENAREVFGWVDRNFTDDISKAKKVYGGVASSAFIDIDDKLYVFGSNRDGMLGFNDSKMEDIIIRYPTYLSIPNVNKVKKVSISNDHMVVLDMEGNMYGAGNNEYGKVLPNGEKYKYTSLTLIENGVKDIAAGFEYTLYIGKNNIVFINTAYGKHIIYDLNEEKIMGRKISCGAYSSLISIIVYPK